MTPEAQRVAELYDRKAGEYDQHYLRHSDRAEDLVLYGWVDRFARGRRVLDVGCGTGLALEYLHPRSYVGVDLSAAMLDRCDERIARVRRERLGLRAVCEGPIDWCGMADHRAEDYELNFDLAFSLWAFPHFPDHALAMERMARAVRPGGVVIVQGFAARYANRPNYILNGDGPDLLAPTTPDQLIDLAERAGLRTERVYGFRFRLDDPRAERIPTRLLAVGMRLSSYVLPQERAATHVLVARRWG